MLSRLRKTGTFLKIIMNYDVTDKKLRRLFRSFGTQKNHQLFEYCLEKMDYSLDLSYCKMHDNKKFIFEGRGHSTIKPYRILGTNKNKCFEKIFYSDSQDAKANLYFYQNTKKLLKNKDITIPACKDIKKGKKFTAFIYEYLDLKPLKSGTEYQHLKSATISLCQGVESKVIADAISYEKVVDGKSRIKKMKIFSPAEMKTINKTIKLLPVYFQHLDLKEQNVFQNKVIVDWDNAGWHPMGMDFGRLLLSFFIFHENIFYENYMEEIIDYHSSLHVEVPFETFRRAVIYYFIVFYYGHFIDQGQTKQFMNLIESYKSTLSY